MAGGDCAAITALSEMVARFRPHHEAHGELEFRLGTLDATTGSFTTGVSRDTFEQLERDMSDVLASDRVWNEIVDYYYLDDTGTTLRTRVSFDNKNMTMGRCHIRKETLGQTTIARDDDPADACRVSCSVEHPVTDPPTSAIVNYVRVKQQKRFQDVRDGSVVWNFELSKTWSASSRDAVEYQQHHTEPTYEIECELVDASGTYLGERTDAQVGASILMKMKMLLGEETDGRVHLVASGSAGQPRGQRSARRRRRA